MNHIYDNVGALIKLLVSKQEVPCQARQRRASPQTLVSARQA